VSGETLRRAAALMRERAEAATDGPWSAEAIGSEGYHVFGPNGSRAPMKGRARVAACTWQDWDEVEADAEHIASWHPAVALAVADWLWEQANLVEVHAGTECDGGCLHPTCRCIAAALAVARAYLGSES
jgi:hypothetical protein